MMPNLKALSIAAFLALVLAVPLARWWLRPPVVTRENLRYLPLLRTALSARSPQWLDGVERVVSARQQEGRLSDSERRHFDKIIAAARGGDWERADRLAAGFESAQAGRRRADVGAEAACCPP